VTTMTATVVATVTMLMTTTLPAAVLMTHEPRPPPPIQSFVTGVRVARHRCEQPHRCHSNRHSTTVDAHDFISLVSKSAVAILGGYCRADKTTKVR